MKRHDQRQAVQMRRARAVWHLVSIICFCASLCAVSAASAQQPNFLVIIADDMGFSDAGCYGGEIETPNLNSLAASGLRYTQFYNTARCWPTRSALVTGYYPQQIRRDNAPGLPRSFGGGGKRPKWARTIAEYLRPAGYRSYHSGKWHVDGEPTKSGFDRSDQISRGPGFFDSIKREDRDDAYYRTVATADYAIDCLKEHAKDFGDQPFFQYVAFHAPHFPLHALPEDIARYRDRYLDGWDVLREERHTRQLQMGIHNAALSRLEPDLGPPYAFPEQIKQLGPGELDLPLPWKHLNAEQRRFQATKMAIHAAMVDRMDQEIGRILDQIRAMGQFENTFICFLSDNGASAEIMVRGEGHDPDAPMGSAATYLCLGPGFSSAANTPFRRHKTWVHEGGVSTPMIVSWPRGIAARNELRRTVGHVVDIAPTILDIAGIGPPTDAPVPMSGRSMRATFAADGQELHEQLWFSHDGHRALRQGDWKIVHAVPTPIVKSGKRDRDEDTAFATLNWSLYNLASDRAEQNDLSQQHPQRVQHMASAWKSLRDQFLKDASVKDASENDASETGVE